MMGFLSHSTKNHWYIDSGATQHMTSYGDLLDNKIDRKDKVTAANGEKINIIGVGDGRVTFNGGVIKLKKVMHVPGLAVNLLSVSQIVQNGNTVVFDARGCSVYNDQNNKV